MLGIIGTAPCIPQHRLGDAQGPICAVGVRAEASAVTSIRTQGEAQVAAVGVRVDASPTTPACGIGIEGVAGSCPAPLANAAAGRASAGDRSGEPRTGDDTQVGAQFPACIALKSARVVVNAPGGRVVAPPLRALSATPSTAAEPSATVAEPSAKDALAASRHRRRLVARRALFEGDLGDESS